MKFIASQEFINIAKGASKEILWKVYARKTISLNGAIEGYAGWIDVSGYIINLPTITTRVEYEYGQFTADSIELTVADIKWWDTNIFNALSGEYIEIKIEAKLGINGKYVPDVAYMFAGIVDKSEIAITELSDTATIKAYTYEDIAGRITAEVLTTKNINTNIDGFNKNGLVLPKIPGLYITAANLTGYVLKNGTHILSYNYNEGTPTIKLDGGNVKTLIIGGETTVGNNDNDTKDTQRIKVYCANVIPVIDIQDEIIVLTEGDLLPKTWHRGKHIPDILNEIYSYMGITTEQDINYTTWDNNAVLTYLDCPPYNGQYMPMYKNAGIVIQNKLYIACRNRVYRKNSPNNWELVFEIESGAIIQKMFYDAVDNYLWFIYAFDGTYDVCSYARHWKYNDQVSNRVLINARAYCCEFYRSPDNDIAGLIYINDNAVRYVNYSLNQFVVYTSANLGYTTYGLINNFMFIYDGKIRFVARHNNGSYEYVEIYYNYGWVYSKPLTGIENYNIATYNSVYSRIYYYNSSTLRLSSHSLNSNTKTDHITFIGGTNCNSIASIDGTYFTVFGNTVGLYRVEGTSAAELLDNNISTEYYSIFLNENKPMGVASHKSVNRDYLFQYSSELSSYIQYLQLKNMSVRDALNKILVSNNLTATISATKKGIIFKRNNLSGSLTTTVNTIIITVSEAEDISQNVHYQRMKLVTVSNGRISVSYDGTIFNSNALNDAETFTMTSNFIQDNAVKSLCYYIYQYFSQNRKIYEIRLGLVPLFQYELFDRAQLNFVATKIQTSENGVIYSVDTSQDGTITYKILI